MNSGEGVQRLIGVPNGHAHTQQVDLASTSNFYRYGNRPKRDRNDTDKGQKYIYKKSYWIMPEKQNFIITLTNKIQ
jgi:hypothetical protein